MRFEKPQSSTRLRMSLINNVYDWQKISMGGPAKKKAGGTEGKSGFGQQDGAAFPEKPAEDSSPGGSPGKKMKILKNCLSPKDPVLSITKASFAQAGNHASGIFSNLTQEQYNDLISSEVLAALLGIGLFKPRYFMYKEVCVVLFQLSYRAQLTLCV